MNTALPQALKTSARVAEEVLYKGLQLQSVLGSPAAIPGAVHRTPWPVKRLPQAHQQPPLTDKNNKKEPPLPSKKQLAAAAAAAAEAGVRVASPWTVAAAKIARRHNEAEAQVG